MAYHRRMADLYRRLKALGFDATFVRSALLPDWWEDALADVPANRALAETAIARHLRLNLAALRDPAAELALPGFNNVRLKSFKGASPAELRPAMLVARRVAELIVPALSQTSAFPGLMPAAAVRRAALADCGCVNLSSLLRFAWGHGIAVIHLRCLPGRKFDGMALFVQGRPVVLLASGRDSPPWLAFHLAHELGHLLLGHVTADSEPLVDSDIDGLDDDQQEAEADRFACEVLTGLAELTAEAVYGLTAEKLARSARSFGQRNAVDPGVLALIYGRHAGRFPAAQAALRILGQDQGAQRMIGAELSARLRSDELAESGMRLLEHVALDAVEAV